MIQRIERDSGVKVFSGSGPFGGRSLIGMLDIGQFIASIVVDMVSVFTEYIKDGTKLMLMLRDFFGYLMSDPCTTTFTNEIKQSRRRILRQRRNLKR